MFSSINPIATYLLSLCAPFVKEGKKHTHTIISSFDIYLQEDNCINLHQQPFVLLALISVKRNLTSEYSGKISQSRMQRECQLKGQHLQWHKKTSC